MFKNVWIFEVIHVLGIIQVALLNLIQPLIQIQQKLKFLIAIRIVVHTPQLIKGIVTFFYKPFNTLSTTRKKETAVHEFGHIIGLDHTQKSNESKSVRRAKGFIDKAGLNYIY
ncbi:hypothetical protein CHH62_02955 [Niallia circulans]|nr:hypothetical protein CHH62_02955 [Niallia circulans]